MASLALVLSSQHRVRLAFGSVALLDSAEQASWAPIHDPEISRRYSACCQAEDCSGNHDLERATEIMASFTDRFPPRNEDPLPAIDDPDSSLALMKQGHVLHCYNQDIAASRLLARHGIYTRLWDMNGPDKLGEDGHNLLEVWDRTERSWIVLDPYYHCYFVAATDTMPLSFAKLRHLLLAQPLSVHLRHYTHDREERPEPYVIPELRYLAPGAILHANNDYRWRYDHRYGALMGLTSLFDRLPLRISRGIRTLLMGTSDMKYVVNDHESPHFPFIALRLLFIGLLVLTALSVLGYTALACYTFLQQRKLANPAQSLPSAQLEAAL